MKTDLVKQDISMEELAQEIKSPILKAQILKLHKIYSQLLNGEITPHQASAENASIKHIIQAVALDWLYSRKMQNLPTAIDSESRRA